MGNHADLALEHNIFFEGGDRETNQEFEGGSEDDVDLERAITEEVAETIVSKRTKKKKKKKNGTFKQSKISRKNSVGAVSANVHDFMAGVEIEDFRETLKSGKSLKKKKKKGSKKNGTARSKSKKSVGDAFSEAEDDGIRFNSQFDGGFLKAKSVIGQEEDNQSVRSGRSLKFKKKRSKKKGSRASSRASSRSSNRGDELKPDVEAELIIPKKKITARLQETDK